MRLVGALVALVLATSTSFAERPPFEVVRVLPETQQVLVFDRPNNTHVLLTPGSTFYGYSIVEISGIGMIVEKQQARIAMYPRGTQDIVLNLNTDRTVQAPQPIYGKVPVAPTPTPIADASVIKANEKKAEVARDLAALLTSAPVTPAPKARRFGGARLPGRMLEP